MSNIIVDADGKSISSNENGSIHINISQTEKNGIYGFDDMGRILTKRGETSDAGGEMNTPGNSIGYVSSSSPLNVIQCNSSVSRIKKGDPSPSNEGVYMPGLINKIKESLAGG